MLQTGHTQLYDLSVIFLSVGGPSFPSTFDQRL